MEKLAYKRCLHTNRLFQLSGSLVCFRVFYWLKIRLHLFGLNQLDLFLFTFLGFFLATASSMPIQLFYLDKPAEGDLWRSSSFPLHLIVHSFMCGSAFILAMTPLHSNWRNVSTLNEKYNDSRYSVGLDCYLE